MSILALQVQQPTGLASVTPSVIYILTSDTYAEVTATGYLTNSKQEGFSFANEQMALVYTSDDGPVWFKVVITYSGATIQNPVVSLVAPSVPGAVTLPTVTGNLIKSTNTDGTLADAAVAVADVQLNTNILAVRSADEGGAGSSFSITNASITASSVVIAQIVSSSNAVEVQKVTPGAGSVAISLSGDPGAACVLNYIVFVAAQ